MAKILVTGGMGYIGSHTIIDLLDEGYEIISIDNYSNSSPEVLSQLLDVTGQNIHNINIDLCDKQALFGALKDQGQIDGIIHFAAYKAVGESVDQPLKYYHNNLLNLINVLEACREFNIPNLIYSSSCTVYGQPEVLPVTEETPIKEAESPYGMTKQMGEVIIKSSLKDANINAVLLRYFNPAGAHESAKIGESPSNIPQNLVPFITETAIGKRKELMVFGDDYNTRDGSCIRDYIHVMDLAHAHTLAIKRLLEKKSSSNLEVYNLGVDQGVSVLEVIKAFETVNNISLNYSIQDRRPGDVESIFADSTKARNELGWEPKRTIEDIMQSAWEWEKKRS